MRYTGSAVGGVAGILFVLAAYAGGFVQGTPPPYDQGGSAISAWFTQNASRYLTGQFISGLGFLLFYFPFLATLCERLRAVEGTEAVWSRAAFGGGILFPAAGISGGVLPTAVALLGGAVSPDVAAMAVAVSAHGFAVSGALGGVLPGCAAVVIIRTGVLPRWLGGCGAAVAAAAFVGSATIAVHTASGLFATVNALGWVGLFLWIFAISIALMRNEGTR